MEERVLARSSDNISKLISLMTIHEYNLKNYLRNRNNIEFQFIFDRSDPSLNNLNSLNNLINEPLNTTYHTFEDIENKNETTCPITQEAFCSDDTVALLECGHYFKKEAFLSWARQRRSCPTCRTPF